ncbi:TonB-dependent receptor plug domain-containing protein [Roseateles sp. GG27B]
MFEHVPRSLRSLKAQPRPLMRYSSLALAVAGCCCSLAAAAQVSSPSATVELPRVEIVSTGPSNSSGQTKDKVAANVQTATAADLERLHALDLSNYLARALGSVNINEMQGNPFQADVNFRGFTASPLLGTPQGLSVYMDGVRLNQPFGDVVSWDLIPRAAIATVTLMPGSNPLFGLNTLGGALSVQTKDGLKNPGTSVQVLGGANQRAAVEFETGGSNADGLHWFVTGNRFHEKGWRAASPSDVSQLFGKFGRHDGGLDLSLTAAIADNDLTGNGMQEQSALQRDRRSVYTTPDITRNRSLFLNLEASQILSNGIKLAGNAYYRRINTATLNGDANDGALDQSVYQPNSAEQAALLAAGFTGYPSSGANAGSTPFPKWRCIANVLTNQEPNEKCNGLINTTQTLQHNAGLALQASGAGVLAGLTHQWLLGAAYDASRVHFNQGSQFGYINPDRSITAVNGPGAFADGTQNSENAFDARVDLSSRTHTSSVFASSSLALNPQTQLTLSGRFNRNVVQNRDAITPGGGTGSLDGDYVFSHFNPGVGLTFAASKA